MIKQILKSAAFFGFLGCLTIIGMAAHRKPHLKGEQKGKQEFVKNTEIKESIVEVYVQDHSYDLS